MIEQDNFYKGKSQLRPNNEGRYDFDNPEAMSLEECFDAVKRLLEKGRVQIPIYDMLISERTGSKEIVINEKVEFIIVEGIFAFYSPLYELGDLKIFIDTPMEIRLARRITRDMARKAKTKLEILGEYVFVEQSYQKFIEPMKKKADLIIPFSYSHVKFVI